jgi:predicted dehydrogenase
MELVRIGMMSFAHIHAQSYADCVSRIEGAELVGISDDNSERGKAMAVRFDTRFFGDYEALLEQDMDAVIVCSENVRHKDLVVRAAQAGKHVLCEKPLATTIKDGREMIEACRAQGVKLQTALPCRFSPAMIQAREAVRSGRIGRVLAINGTNRGKCPGGWFTDASLSGGGAVIDHTVHVADLMRWTMGSEPTEVYAEIGDLMLHKGFDDSATLTIQFENGAFATLDPSWSRPKSFPTWGDVTMGIIGTEGAIWLDLFGQKMDLYANNELSCTWESWGDNVDLGLVKSFVSAVRDDTPLESTGEDGLAAAAVAIAAYESGRRGEPVAMKEILQ